MRAVFWIGVILVIAWWLGLGNVLTTGNNIGTALAESTKEYKDVRKVIVPADGCVTENNTDPSLFFSATPADAERGYPKTLVKKRTGDRHWKRYQDGDRFVFIKWCGDGHSPQVMNVTRTKL